MSITFFPSVLRIDGNGSDHRPSLLLLVSVLALLLAPGLSAQESKQLATETLDSLQSVRLDPSGALAVESISLDLGAARLAISEGHLIPTAFPDGERAAEFVFSGEADLHMAAPNEIEAAQLELFTGGEALEETVKQAVLAIGNKAALRKLFDRPKTTVESDLTAQAEALYEQWRTGPERRQLDVEASLFGVALDEPGSDSFFAGWFRGEELGDFLYLVDANEAEQITLGQFVTEEATEKERKKLIRQINKQQKRGRMIGLSVDDLGQWDTWVSTSRTRADGQVQAGAAPFEPLHYDLEVRLVSRKLDLEGTARIDFETLIDGARIVPLSLHSDLAVTAVRSAEGETLFHYQNGGSIRVLLPEASRAGATTRLEIDYSGNMIDKVNAKSSILLDTLNWYPHLGDRDFATYSVLLRWPKGFDLMAAGRKIDGGTDSEGRWERRTLDRPAFAFSFEVGNFKLFETKGGIDDHVDITLAFDVFSYPLLSDSKDQILETIADSLTYFEETFGPYPLDQLTVVTAPRSFSQAMLGFVTLSAVMISEDPLIRLMFGFQDGRSVIAHELAHQWWGHTVGWTSYRDQWISEAMANYSAALYARRKLEGEIKPYQALTAGWQSTLNSTLDDGRRLESLGPLVLGQRLFSSKADDAYQAIIYNKGALVLEMLARQYGEETFIRILQALVKGLNGRKISTGDLIAAFEKITDQDLQPFAQQYIYSTGLPDIYYDYDFTALDNGHWEVRGTARQQSPFHYSYRFVDRPGIGLDVEQVADEEVAIAESRIIVPVQIIVYDPSKPDERSKKDQRKKDQWNDPKLVGNRALQTHAALLGEETPFAFELEHEPKELFLDRSKEVFGVFYNERRSPKRTAFYRALDANAARKPEEALDHLARALASEYFTGPAYRGPVDEDVLEEAARQLDVRIHQLQARVFLSQGDLDAARNAITLSEDLIKKSDPQWMQANLAIFQARVALRDGDPKTAYDLLRRSLLKRGVDDTEGYIVLAIAAQAMGETETLAKARKELERADVDMTLIDAAGR